MNRVLKTTFPQFLKFKKYNRSFSFPKKSLERGVNFFSNGFSFGLVAAESGRLFREEMDACFRILFKSLKIKGKFRVKFLKSCLYPFCPVSQKSVGMRMGKGKGSVSNWVCPVRKGRLLFELKKLSFFFMFFYINTGKKKIIYINKINL